MSSTRSEKIATAARAQHARRRAELADRLRDPVLLPLTNKAAAAALGVHPTTVARARREHGLERLRPETKREREAKPSRAERRRRAERLRELGPVPTAEAARELGVSQKVIRTLRQRFDLPVPERQKSRPPAPSPKPPRGCERPADASGSAVPVAAAPPPEEAPRAVRVFAPPSGRGSRWTCQGEDCRTVVRHETLPPGWTYAGWTLGGLARCPVCSGKGVVRGADSLAA